MLVVQPHFLDDVLQQVLGVVAVVNGKIAGVPDLRRLCSEHPGEHGVEGAHPQASGGCSLHRFDAVLHLPGSLVGKGEGEDAEGIISF